MLTAPSDSLINGVHSCQLDDGLNDDEHGDDPGLCFSLEPYASKYSLFLSRDHVLILSTCSGIVIDRYTDRARASRFYELVDFIFKKVRVAHIF